MNTEKMNILEQISLLEKKSRQLEYDGRQRSEQLQRVLSYCDAYIGQLDSAPVYTRHEDERDPDENMRPGEEALDLAAILGMLEEHVDPGGVQIGSSRFFGFIPSGGLYPAALADYIAAVTNRYAGVQFSGPGATWLERKLVRWFAELAGYPPEAEGDLTSGGSIATLSAVVAAREAFGIRSRDVGQTVVYLTALTHHSIHKALRIAGLGDCKLHEISLDERLRMDPDALEQAVISDQKKGLRPWMVVATAGTTDIGSVDPLDAIARVTEDRQLWLHVDAAYGGAFILCEPGRAVLQGMERSDSLILDPHKGLFLPFGSGIVLVRDGRHLRRAYYQDAAYLQDLRADAGSACESAADLSPELSRPFRGLRLWLPLKLAGLAPFRAALEEKMLLARYLHRRLSEMDGFEPGLYPDLSIVTFRYVPSGTDANAFNQRLLEEIRQDGRIFLSSTTLAGTYLLRFAVLSYHSHLADIDLALGIIADQVGRLKDIPVKSDR